MFALAINGSPRKGGNTEILLNEVCKPLADAGWETEYLQIGGKPLRGCLACKKCLEKKNLQCAIKTDIFNEVMAKMVRADALILGSPTYFTDVTSEMKALLDRSGYVAIANGRVFRGKIGAAVVAMRRGGATHVYDTINHMLLMNQVVIPGSTYWNIGIGRDLEDVREDAEGLANMKNLGETIAWLGNAMAPHLDSFPQPA